MHIFFMNSTGVSVWGGGEKWMLLTGEELKSRGHAVYYSGRKDSLFLKKCAAANMPVLPLTIGSDFDPFIIRKLKKFIKDHEIDVIVTAQNKDIRLAGIASKFKNHKAVIARNGLPSIKNNFRYKMLYPRIIDGIIVNAEATAQKYLNYKWIPSECIKLIRNGVDPLPAAMQSPEAIKLSLGLPLDKQIIGTFGKLTRQKQHTIFLEIAAKIRENYPDTVFLIVGDGPERQNLQKFAYDLGILDYVYFAGFQENPLPLYTVCNLVLLTSQDEGMPNVLMEGMLMKRTIVAFDVGGVSELIVSDRNGILVPPNDIYLMTQCVEQLLIDPFTVEKIGNNAYQDVLHKYSLKSMVDETESYFEEVLNKKRGNILENNNGK
jgi:glycosyltransferase involved in cell wall biosynthesis